MGRYRSAAAPEPVRDKKEAHYGKRRRSWEGRARPGERLSALSHTHTPAKARAGELFHSLFYWALIVVNVVVLSWGAMTGNVPAPTLEEDPDC